METIGIFGGTFDPPHVAHLILASEAQAQLNLSKVLWVLTPSPPHKLTRVITPIQLRIDLVQAAIADQPSFELCYVDIDRDPPYFALDTMRLLKATYPGAALVYLLGEDSLGDLPVWHQPNEFIAMCSAIGVMHRPGSRVKPEEISKVLPEIESKARFVNVPLIQISSSEIRSRVAKRQPYRYYLTEKVYRLVNDYQLYRDLNPESVS